MAEYVKLPLPPGWDCKFDQSTGKCYYINYLTKAMQLEDPRIRYKQFQNEKCSTESIPLQPLHGSPYHVYPANNFPAAIRAFQGPNPSLHNVSASPLLSKQQVEMSPILRHGSPQTSKISQLARNHNMQETSFSNQNLQQSSLSNQGSFSSQNDTDAVVAKINNMFPTATENHIRLLLKKYYNREAVVISALQVEKHPVTMPGPFATPPTQRHLFHSNSAFQMTPPATNRRLDIISRTGSPIPGRPVSVASGLYGSPRIGEQIRNSPKPHSSPKMKLRYLKSVFPKADEALLFDILANSDNNVQTASERLVAMGYTKREVQPPRLNNRTNQAGPQPAEQIIPLQPKILTAEEKNAIKVRLQTRYANIAERIICMALESVEYSEDRALQILQIVIQEDESKAKQQTEELERIKTEEAAKVQNQMPNESSLSEPPEKMLLSANNTKTTSSLPSSSSISSSSQSKTIIGGSNQGESRLSTSTLVNYVLEHENVLSSITEADASSTSTTPTSSTITSSSSAATTPNSGIQKHTKLRSKAKKSDHKNIKGRSSGGKHTEQRVMQSRNVTRKPPAVEPDTENKSKFHSVVDKITANGPNPDLCKGPNDEILLADYVTWNGANPDISQGRKVLATGNDKGLLTDRSYSPIGHNSELCKGPKVGLAKGSIYSQLTLANVKCN